WNIESTTGPNSDPYNSPQPGTTAISTVVSMISAEPVLRGASSRDCTSAHAIGAMIAVRTVMEGMPSESTVPMEKKAARMPEYVDGNSERMWYEMRCASPVRCMAKP